LYLDLSYVSREATLLARRLRDDNRDIGSRCDPINRTLSKTDHHYATARDEGDEEGRNRAVEVVLPPPGPQVGVCRLGVALTDPIKFQCTER
jgi:hypothetical protein